MMAALGEHVGNGAEVAVQIFGSEAAGLGLDGGIDWVGRHGQSSSGRQPTSWAPGHGMAA
jgi:hypothetical protein